MPRALTDKQLNMYILIGWVVITALSWITAAIITIPLTLIGAITGVWAILGIILIINFLVGLFWYWFIVKRQIKMGGRLLT